MKASLSRIIERKYLVQQARAAKLDREPTVHLDLLRSREQIFAGALRSAIFASEGDRHLQQRG